MNRAFHWGSRAWVVLTVGYLATAWANNAPQVSNVTASQRGDGSKLVDISYNLADADGDLCTVWVSASSDGGATWAVPVTAVTGAVGSGVTPGSGRHIIWNSAADCPGRSAASTRCASARVMHRRPEAWSSSPAGRSR